MWERVCRVLWWLLAWCVRVVLELDFIEPICPDPIDPDCPDIDWPPIPASPFGGWLRGLSLPGGVLVDD
jgi:hypothetical protein